MWLWKGVPNFCWRAGRTCWRRAGWTFGGLSLLSARARPGIKPAEASLLSIPGPDPSQAQSRLDLHLQHPTTDSTPASWSDMRSFKHGWCATRPVTLRGTLSAQRPSPASGCCSRALPALNRPGPQGAEGKQGAFSGAASWWSHTRDLASSFLFCVAFERSPQCCWAGRPFGGPSLSLLWARARRVVGLCGSVAARVYQTAASLKPRTSAFRDQRNMTTGPANAET